MKCNVTNKGLKHGFQLCSGIDKGKIWFQAKKFSLFRKALSFNGEIIGFKLENKRTAFIYAKNVYIF